MNIPYFIAWAKGVEAYAIKSRVYLSDEIIAELNGKVAIGISDDCSTMVLQRDVYGYKIGTVKRTKHRYITSKPVTDKLKECEIKLPAMYTVFKREGDKIFLELKKTDLHN